MAGAFVDGALKGFNMMERHQSRQFNEQRLSDLDKRNEERYQQEQMRRADLDKQRNAERAEDVAFRKQQAEQNNQHRNATLKSMNDYRNKSLEQRAAETTWQQNWQEQQKLYQQDQGDIALGWQAFRTYGRVPEALEEVFARNPTKDPRKYTDPSLRESVKQLHSVMGEAIKTGQLSKVNEPDSIKLFNNVFKEKINSSVGHFDKLVGAKIADVNFAGFVPVEDKEGRVALALEVTYENGSKEVKPMTKGRTSQSDDPVLTFTPKELIGTINSAATMADMMERPEYYDRLGKQLNANMGIGTRPSGRSKSPKDEYRKQLNSIQDEMTKALAKIEGGSDLDYLEDGGREQAINRVRALYQQRIDQLNSSYGIESNQHGEQENIANKSIDNLSDDELLKQLTSALGAQ
ncbi:hypothetical protein CWC25_12130 [Pseudoalteromonas sp. S4389]|uniref:hypothetical protein n=1 Tax=Pseudoalteromonas sp. S4389 TaxID=579556 RepID=UPI0011091A11|nr:hypothetical protein [Pseudoalteromonas sp. S4389]TMO43380.1 hypothetical protein CWC25_12130 [Pseudoalteromonas sp. S4389]